MIGKVWTDWGKFSRYQASRGRAVAEALRDAAEVGAEILTRTSQKILEDKIYAIPVKHTRRGFRPRWRRTRRLIDNEEFVASGVDIRHHNDTPYAIYRYQLGLEGHRQPIWPTLSVQWPDEAIKFARRAVFQIRADYLRQAHERPEDFI